MQFEDSNKNNDQATRDFIYLMSTSQINIYAYIMSIVGNTNDADDIMQNVSAYMWERFSQFKSGTDFVAWGMSIAYYKIKEFRKSKARNQFSGEAMELIHKKAQQNLGDMNLYVEKLNHCISKLPASDLALVKLRYESGNSIKRISTRINVTVQAVYSRLSNIHGMLSRCIKRAIIKSDRSKKIEYLFYRYSDGSITKEEMDSLNSLILKSEYVQDKYFDFLKTEIALSHSFQGKILVDTNSFQNEEDSKVLIDSNTSLRGVDIEEFIADADDSEMTRDVLELLELERTSPAVEIEKPKPVKPERELIQKVERDFKWFPGRPSKRKLRFLAAMAASIMVTIGYLYFFAPENIDRPVVASLADSINAVWDHELERPDKFGKMVQSRYHLKQGYVVILLKDGASVTVEAPAELFLLSADSMELFSGRIYAIVPERAKGFSVKTGNNKIVDLGTEFGVEVDNTRNMQLHVTKGKTLLYASLKNNFNPPVSVEAGVAKKVYNDGFVKDIKLEDHKFVRRINSKNHLVSKDDPVEVIYEPFDYKPGPLDGQAGASEIGLDGTWTAHAESNIVAGSLAYGSFPLGGNSIQIVKSGNHFGGARKISPSALAGNSLLDDGATLWFSVEMGVNTGANPGNSRMAFALANDQFNSSNSKMWIDDDGGQLGSGIGVFLGKLDFKVGSIAATQFRDLASGDDRAGLIYGDSYDTGIDLGEHVFVVGKIVWDAASDTIELYVPGVDLNLGTPVSTLTVDVDKSAYDTITWARSERVLLDEIRFGNSYTAVLGAHGPTLVSPEDKSSVDSGNVTLSWENLRANDPNNGTFVNVWFGTVPEALTQVITANAVEPDVTSYNAGYLEPGTYYWRIDSYIDGPDNIAEPNRIEGYLYTFFISDLPSIVDAGPNMVSWLGQPVPITSTISDDGAAVLSYQWSCNPNPNLVVSYIPSDAVADPEVTVTFVGTPGSYTTSPVTMTLTVSDGIESISDTMTIDIYPDACQATRQAAGESLVNDLNLDCIIDLADLAKLAADWLIDYSRTEAFVDTEQPEILE